MLRVSLEKLSLIWTHNNLRAKEGNNLLFVWFVGNLQQRPVFARAHVNPFSKHKPSLVNRPCLCFIRNVFHLKGWVGGFLTRVRKKFSSFPPCFHETFPTLQKFFWTLGLSIKATPFGPDDRKVLKLSPVVKRIAELVRGPFSHSLPNACRFYV